MRLVGRGTPNATPANSANDNESICVQVSFGEIVPTFRQKTFLTPEVASLGGSENLGQPNQISSVGSRLSVDFSQLDKTNQISSLGRP